jgi:hypothetical protein
MVLQKLSDTKETVASMAQLLESKHARLAATLDGNYPQLQNTVWQAEDTVQSAVQTLSPQMSENKLKVCNSRPPTRCWLSTPKAPNPKI